MAAALDAVKENASLPWIAPRDASSSINTSSVEETRGTASESDPPLPPKHQNPTDNAEGNLEKSSRETDAKGPNSDPVRILRMAHFEKALKEITPSASEQMGSLADLRKWNEEFGEGGRKRGKRIWGGRFGFVVKGGNQVEEGRVQQP